MPTTFDLINLERLGSITFIISSLEALASSDKAEQAELERQGTATPSSTSASEEASKLALDSSITSAISYVLLLITAIIRKKQLEEQVQSGTTNTSIIPNILIVAGFIVSLIGVIIRIPAIQQRLAEAQVPTIL